MEALLVSVLNGFGSEVRHVNVALRVAGSDHHLHAGHHSTAAPHAKESTTPRNHKRTGQDRTGQDTTGHNRTEQDRTGEARTEQDRTEQDRTGHSRTR